MNDEDFDRKELQVIRHEGPSMVLGGKQKRPLIPTPVKVILINASPPLIVMAVLWFRRYPGTIPLLGTRLARKMHTAADRVEDVSLTWFKRLSP